ncbi:hypothetical protein BaRGS_00001974 [Batillaria attramentaria]|uniref:DUF218 domain-containing protein n=1 Tax=Batillaria attramentaria TaxID=370345 RepID=A0ABD0M545_9CAEN
MYMLWLVVGIVTVVTHTDGRHSNTECEAVPSGDLNAAQTIWNYMLMNHTLRRCDVIVALGSYDVRVARHAADMFLAGYGQWLVVTGKTGNLTAKLWTVPEADIFRAVAVGRGVPADRILAEAESTNSGQNMQNTHRLLSHLAIPVSSVLLVQKPYMERRAYATFLKQWPEVGGSGSDVNVDVIVTSPDIDLVDYPNDDVGSLSDVISVMLGDMQRIFLYGEAGFQAKQFVPSDVKAAYEYLAKKGRYCGYFQ